MSKVVHVAVGIIYRTHRIFLTKRLKDAHQGGKWEFPGGKVEINETVAEALARELKEEVAIDVLSCEPLTVIEHDYGDKKVCLHVYIVDQFLHEPKAQEGQEQAWTDIDDLTSLEFPAANKAIISLVIEKYKN